ncbi:MAG: MMPL family transporter [Oscillospiraceae bacterium]|nr:MMPL family transporter [Oscillospiraceae bacterium]
MYKLAAFIVDKRNLFFLLFIFAMIFSVFASGWTEVEDDVTTYLAEETETRQGLTVMNDQFITYGSGSVMVANVTKEQAEKLAEEIENIDGVSEAKFDGTEEHYKNTYALFSVTFDGEEGDEISASAMTEIKELLSPYDLYIDSAVGSDEQAQLDEEMQVVSLVAVVIIITVLLFTSNSYAELPVLLMTFGSAALLNKGTNFLCGKISFISNSVTVVLQLALAIDYAIILMNRYTEEHRVMPAREACITALSKAIPEISSSSLTTISGLGALAFMSFKIGADLSIVLIKAIFLSLLSVFTLMPGLIMLFSEAIDKSAHKSFVPKISAVGKFAFATKYVIPPLFVVLAVVGFSFSNKCPYAYGNTMIESPRKNESQLAAQKIEDSFGSTNLLAIVVPSGDYEKEGRLISELTRLSGTDSMLGLANIEAMDGYMLTDKLTPRQFSELAGLDYEVAKVIYAAYAVNDEDYGEVVNGLDSYGVPLIDMFIFAYDEVEKGYVNLDEDLQSSLDELHETLDKALLQLKTDEYSRILLYSNLPEEGEESFAFLDEVHEVMAKYYPEDAYIVGNSTSDYDLSSSFSNDNMMISILSALFVIIILLFTFKSAGLPVLLIVIIEGSIWLNFSFPYLSDKPLYFLSYLIVSSIQMGANIDYAIVISSRYMELKKELPMKMAITETLNQAFPTIVTSGTMLAAAGFLIGILSTNPIISAIGTCLGRGTVISICLVMFALPQILILGDVIIEKTSFTLKKRERVVYRNSKVTVSGLVRGYVNGRIEGIVTGVIIGDLDAKIESKSHFEAESLVPLEYIEAMEQRSLPDKSGQTDNVGQPDDWLSADVSGDDSDNISEKVKNPTKKKRQRSQNRRNKEV